MNVDEAVSRNVLELERKNEKRSLVDTTPGEIIQIERDTELIENDVVTTIDGTNVTRYYETFHGIPVYDTVASIEVDSEHGTYTGQASGQLLQDIQNDVISVIPTLNEDEALSLAKHFFGGVVDEYSNEKIELVIYPVSNVATLAYKISYIAFEKGKIARRLFIINANSGTLLKELNLLPSFQVKATGGNTKIGKLEYGNSMPFLEVRGNDGQCILANSRVKVYDLKHGKKTKKGDHPYTFDCRNGIADEKNGAYSPLSDAFFYADRVFKMYEEFVHAPVIKEQPVQLWVHYGEDAVVAQFSGPMLMFGDGRKNLFYPMVSADVVGHELTHGFIEEHSGLEYSGQSGALDESFADIAGEAAEEFIFGKHDYKSGEDISMGYKVREICNPEADGRSIDHVRDYSDDLDVHFTSGVVNKAACLLSKADDFDIMKVFQIFAHANRFYWHPTTNFSAAACGIAKAAYDLGHYTDDISVAFEKVGIEVCAMDNYTRTLHTDATIKRLQAKGDEKIVFKFNIKVGKSFMVYTMNGDGDVDVTVDAKRKLRGAKPMYSSKSKGNLEMINIDLNFMRKGYITLKPKKKSMFSGVKFSVRIKN
ncbi:Virulence metalloprotease [Mizuhopecten yessoensis]|uniref:Virulence metalloprotease n=2 Tax=Mizuhopecten yessoensis TaxID=6573 RepID=A0A210QXH2_MIZYE|nr:Virulence metalloprotease [Mizuhopecten yessoensis]